MSAPYAYPTSNLDLINTHNLEKHFEGGYFAQTLAISNGATAFGPSTQLLAGPSPPQPADAKLDATAIYYLLTPDSSRGKMHMNLHTHLHIHQAGRALYTLIKPTHVPGEEPSVHRVILGPNVKNGEVTQLFVPGGWWKASEIPDEDLLLLEAPAAKDEGLQEKIGCLITEVVIPGWTPDQHKFISLDILKDLWSGHNGWQMYTRYLSSA